MRNWCYRCNSSGKIQDLNAKWWQFWKTIVCPVCNGNTEILPPKEKPLGRPPAPPPVPTKPIVIIFNDEKSARNFSAKRINPITRR